MNKGSILYPQAHGRNQEKVSKIEMTEQDKVSQTILLDKTGTLVNQRQISQKEINSTWNLARLIL